MLITKEHQEALLASYAKTHNTDECIGFIDGMSTLIESLIKREIDKLDEVEHELGENEQLKCLCEKTYYTWEMEENNCCTCNGKIEHYEL